MAALRYVCKNPCCFFNVFPEATSKKEEKEELKMGAEKQKESLKELEAAAIKHTNTREEGGNAEKTAEEVGQSVLRCIEQGISLEDIKRALNRCSLPP